MWAVIVLLMQVDRVTFPAEKSDLECPGPGRGHRDVSPGSRAWRGNNLQGLDTGSCIPEELGGEMGAQ